jgi:hypothetical protein
MISSRHTIGSEQWLQSFTAFAINRTLSSPPGKCSTRMFLRSLRKLRSLRSHPASFVGEKRKFQDVDCETYGKCFMQVKDLMRR